MEVRVSYVLPIDPCYELGIELHRHEEFCAIHTSVGKHSRYKLGMVPAFDVERRTSNSHDSAFNTRLRWFAGIDDFVIGVLQPRHAVEFCVSTKLPDTSHSTIVIRDWTQECRCCSVRRSFRKESGKAGYYRRCPAHRGFLGPHSHRKFCSLASAFHPQRIGR